MLSTYVQPLSQCPVYEGGVAVIHAALNQTNTATGRLSSRCVRAARDAVPRRTRDVRWCRCRSNPNLQNLPARGGRVYGRFGDEIEPVLADVNIRGAFGPRAAGRVFLTVDYSQVLRPPPPSRRCDLCTG